MVDPADVHAMGNTSVSYTAPRLSDRALLEHAHACSERFEMENDSRTRFGHVPQTTSSVALQAQSWHWSAAHREQRVAFPRWQYELLGHGEHWRSVVGVHGVVSYVPLGHSGLQSVLLPTQNAFNGHSEHARSVVLVHGVDSNVPGAQTGVHSDAFTPPTQYVSRGHGEQTRSVLAVHGTDSNVPLLHFGEHFALCRFPEQNAPSGHLEHTLALTMVHFVV